MNILMILTNPFTHDPRVYNEARSLVEAGHSVTVFAWDKKRENPQTEVIEKINVIRNYNSKFMDIFPYDLMRLHFWWIKGYKDALKPCKKNNFDIIHCHDWHTGLIPYFLTHRYNKDKYFEKTASVFTIHNLIFQFGRNIGSYSFFSGNQMKHPGSWTVTYQS